MCGGLDLYRPDLARASAEHRLQAAWGQAEAERAAVDRGLGWAMRLWTWLRRPSQKEHVA